MFFSFLYNLKKIDCASFIRYSSLMNFWKYSDNVCVVRSKILIIYLNENWTTRPIDDSDAKIRVYFSILLFCYFFFLRQAHFRNHRHIYKRALNYWRPWGDVSCTRFYLSHKFKLFEIIKNNNNQFTLHLS